MSVRPRDESRVRRRDRRRHSTVDAAERPLVRRRGEHLCAGGGRCGRRVGRLDARSWRGSGGACTGPRGDCDGGECRLRHRARRDSGEHGGGRAAGRERHDWCGRQDASADRCGRLWRDRRYHHRARRHGRTPRLWPFHRRRCRRHRAICLHGCHGRCRCRERRRLGLDCVGLCRRRRGRDGGRRGGRRCGDGGRCCRLGVSVRSGERAPLYLLLLHEFNRRDRQSTIRCRFTLPACR
mmetsp:Transcript_52686/g.140215  ORF Transcript_52686/g.140215 Transcript_52686/m.140215 type:complete len:238 (+) Transcript_52686:185-898(+)